MPLYFMTKKKKKKIVSKFRKKLVEAKAAEPWSVGFWKRNFNSNVRKKNQQHTRDC